MEVRRIPTNDTELNVALDGAGPPVLLMHGWPHTWQVWRPVLPLLTSQRRVIAPDLRGLGDSADAADGFDAATGADDMLGLLDALGVDRADVVALDAGVPAAFLLGVRHPTRVRRLVLMEAVLPGLPGGFAQPPWWFGFHSAPGLAETVLEGHEGAYLDWFLTAGTYERRGVPPEIRDAFVHAYTGREALRRGFGYYRAAEQNATAILAAGRLTVPTLAVGGNTVGDLLHHQLAPVTDELTGTLVARSGHLVPLDRPDAVAELILASPERVDSTAGYRRSARPFAEQARPRVRRRSTTLRVHQEVAGRAWAHIAAERTRPYGGCDVAGNPSLARGPGGLGVAASPCDDS